MINTHEPARTPGPDCIEEVTAIKAIIDTAFGHMEDSKEFAEVETLTLDVELAAALPPLPLDKLTGIAQVLGCLTSIVVAEISSQVAAIPTGVKAAL